MSAAVVLLSGGQDSTTCLYWALQNYDSVHAVSIAYGQRHAIELTAAESIAGVVKVPWTLLHLDALSELGDSSLVTNVSRSQGYIDHEAPGGLPTSFVPGRNILFLTLAAAYACKVGAGTVVGGMCQTDYSGYPDCRAEFILALEQAIRQGFPSSAKIHFVAPLMWLTKAESVRLARRLPGCWGALRHTVTCYQGKIPGCGECPSCILRARGFAEAGENDPALGAL